MANENPMELAKKILEKVDCGYVNISQELLSAFRLKPKRTTETPPLLVKLGSSSIKKMVFKTLKESNKKLYCDDFGLSIRQQIYFNHHLTTLNQNLLGKARNLKKKCDFEAAYYANGYIWLKKTQHSLPIRISCENDLNFDSKI